MILDFGFLDFWIFGFCIFYFGFFDFLDFWIFGFWGFGFPLAQQRAPFHRVVEGRVAGRRANHPPLSTRTPSVLGFRVGPPPNPPI